MSNNTVAPCFWTQCSIVFSYELTVVCACRWYRRFFASWWCRYFPYARRKWTVSLPYR